MKNKVIAWLQGGCNFEEGVKLLDAAGIYRNFLHICQRQGETTSNKSMLEYQLIVLAGMTEKQAKSIKKTEPAKKKKVAMFSHEANTKKLVHECLSPITLDPQRTKLREEFPFLSDPGCPDELKILVSDKITAYLGYVSSHERLFTAKTKEETFSAARDTVEFFINNRRIYLELEHYKRHRHLLMQHPIFERRKREQEISEMKASELSSLEKQLEMNIWRNKKLIEKEPGHKQTFNRAQKVKNYEYEISVVKRMLEMK